MPDQVQALAQAANVRSLSLRDPRTILLVASIATYSVLFSWLAIMRMNALETYAYDLGIYNQALYTTLTGKGLLYYTPDLLANPQGSFLGVHFSPVLFLILPIYAIHPAPETLLLLQTVLLALGAIPVFLIAKRRLTSRYGPLLVSLVYLLNPALQGVNWYDFHPEALIVLPLLFALYFFDIRRASAYFSSLAFVLVTIETAAVLGIGLGAYAVLESVRQRLRKDRTYLLRLGFSTIAVSVAWFALSAATILHFNPGNIYLVGGSSYWQVLGAKNLLQVPYQTIVSPESAIRAVSYAFPQKMLYLLVLFGPVLFLPVATSRPLVMLVPWLSASILSNYQPYFELGNQYPAYIIAPLFYAAIIGLQRLENRPHFRTRSLSLKWITTSIAAGSMIFLIASSPLTPWAVGSFPPLYYGYPAVTSHTQVVDYFARLIPPDASVLASQNIFPLVSSRANAFTPPTSVFYPPGTSFTTQLDLLLSKVDFILVDMQTSTIDSVLVLSDSTVSKQFGLLAYSQGAYLLEHGYRGKPILDDPTRLTFDYRDLSRLPNVSTVRDTSASAPMVLVHSKSPSADFWYGPYVILSPGKYETSFDLKIGEPLTGDVMTVSVVMWPTPIIENVQGNNKTGMHLLFSIGPPPIKTTLTSRTVSGGDFGSNGEYRRFELGFNVTQFGVYEFPGLNVQTSGSVFLDQIQVLQLSAFSTLGSSTVLTSA
jgi:uncharacterized membrane protein